MTAFVLNGGCGRMGAMANDPLQRNNQQCDCRKKTLIAFGVFWILVAVAAGLLIVQIM